MSWYFTLLSTLFKSYRDDGRVVKVCAMFKLLTLAQAPGDKNCPLEDAFNP